MHNQTILKQLSKQEKMLPEDLFKERFIKICDRLYRLRYHSDSMILLSDWIEMKLILRKGKQVFQFGKAEVLHVSVNKFNETTILNLQNPNRSVVIDRGPAFMSGFIYALLDIGITLIQEDGKLRYGANNDNKE